MIESAYTCFDNQYDTGLANGTDEANNHAAENGDGDFNNMDMPEQPTGF